MAKYKIEIKKSAVKEVKQLPAKDIKKILKKIMDLGDDPHPPDSKKLSGHDRYRLRYRHYRILYEIVEDILIIYVVRIGHRKDIYRK
ncbi:MAG: type II toxin-antitoxin system RelE/ParE family toxin [Candidatus Omnitrophota bacterium]